MAHPPSPGSVQCWLLGAPVPCYSMSSPGVSRRPFWKVFCESGHWVLSGSSQNLPFSLRELLLLCSESSWGILWIQCGHHICLRVTAWFAAHTVNMRNNLPMAAGHRRCRCCFAVPRLGHRQAQSHRGTQIKKEEEESFNPENRVHPCIRDHQEPKASCGNCALCKLTFLSAALGPV